MRNPFEQILDDASAASSKSTQELEPFLKAILAIFETAQTHTFHDNGSVLGLLLLLCEQGYATPQSEPTVEQGTVRFQVRLTASGRALVEAYSSGAYH